MWSWAAASWVCMGWLGEPQAGQGVSVLCPCPCVGSRTPLMQVVHLPYTHLRAAPASGLSWCYQSSWGATRASPWWAPPKTISAPTAAFNRPGKFGHLLPKRLGMEVKGLRSVCNNSVSLFQVKEPSLMQDTKLTLGWKTSLNILRGCPPSPEPKPANLQCISN